MPPKFDGGRWPRGKRRRAGGKRSAPPALAEKYPPVPPRAESGSLGQRVLAALNHLLGNLLP
jgi:hypothetical protein